MKRSTMLQKIIWVGTFLLLIIGSAFAAETSAFEIPTPQNSEMIREVNLDPPSLLAIIRNENPDLEKFIKEIKKVKVTTFRWSGDAQPVTFLKSYESQLDTQSWNNMIRDLEKPSQISAVYNKPDGNLLVLSLSDKKELTAIFVQGVFDFKATEKMSKTASLDGSGIEEPNALGIASEKSSEKTADYSFQEIPMGDPDWATDPATGLVTGKRTYRPAIIPAKLPGKLVLDGFTEIPQIHKWDRDEVVLNYKKEFTGNTKEKALEMDKRCLLMVDMTSNGINVHQALAEVSGSPATEVTGKIIMDITIPNSWTVDSLKKN